MRTLLIAAILSFGVTALGAPATPSDEQMRRLSAELDRLQKVFASTPQFGEQFWRESKRVADRFGPEIIHAVMRRSKKWRDEEGLIFVPLVALLPRKAALDVLRQYERSSDPAYRSWAHEFVIEFDADDVKESVRKISGKR